MNILCSAEADSGQVGMYNIQLVEKDVYKATLQKFTGSKLCFPGMLLLRRNTDNWLCYPEGYSSIVDCLVNELEKLFPPRAFN